MNILIVEDEKRLADALAQIFTEKKYKADVVYDGENGLEYARSGIYDCAVFDVMLPKMNGFDIVKTLRAESNTLPILMLTAKDTIPDKVHGLDIGADDYMTKPFSPEELLARVRVISRRKGEVVVDELKFEDLCFNITTCELENKENGKHIHLNFKEAELIKLFLARPNTVLSKEEIITKVWGYDSDAGDNNVEAYVSFLRRKLFFVGSKCEIQSVKKMGYIFGEAHD